MDIANIIDLILDIGIPAALILFSLTFGRMLERRHLRQLDQREAACRDVMVTDLRSFPGLAAPSVPDSQTPQTLFVTGEACIAADYLRFFLSNLKKIIGGRMGGYELLASRARREAHLRMLEQARSSGFNAICNIRYDTADIGNAQRSKGGGIKIAVLATGTAYRTKQ